jgi:hypothetical protein
MGIMRRLLMVLPLVSLIVAGGLSAQETPEPSQQTLTVSDTTRDVERVQVFEEQVLETIRIEAVIEKPSVMFVPKRTETHVGEVPFVERRFDAELGQKPSLLLEYGKELEGGRRMEKIKKLLANEEE